MHLLAKFFVFWGVMIGVFWKRESRPIKWHQCRLITRQLSPAFTSIVYGFILFDSTKYIDTYLLLEIEQSSGIIVRHVLEAPRKVTDTQDESPLSLGMFGQVAFVDLAHGHASVEPAALVGRKVDQAEGVVP